MAYSDGRNYFAQGFFATNYWHPNYWSGVGSVVAAAARGINNLYMTLVQ